MDEKLILENIPLIYKVIKDMHCYWKTEDEFQSLYDAGLEGLIRGAKSYDNSKGKHSTFLYQCIRNMICREIYSSELDKRKINKEIMISLDKEVDPESDTTYKDYLEDVNVNIEAEIEKKLEVERLLSAVNSLKSQKDKLAIKKYYGLEGYSMKNCEEIAKEFGVSRTMIATRIRRCYPKLKKWLERNSIEAFMLENNKNKR